jgi:transcriptional regulator with XRE-family HTH domain
VRGRRSQTAYARKLGYTSNVPYEWESGRRYPPASTFFAALRAAGLDVDPRLAEYLRGAPEEARGQPPAVAVLLDAAHGSTRVEVAARAGVGAQAIGRWLAGRSDPRLPDLLRVIDLAGRRLPDFVATWVDPEQVPSMRERWRQLQASRALVRASPWTSAVLLCFELASYRALPAHVRGFVAERLGIDVALEDAAVDLLAAAGQIRTVRGRYVRVETAPIDAREARPAADLKRFWAGVAVERLDRAALVSWNLLAVSRADLAALREVQRESFRQMRQIVERSEPVEVVALAHWSLGILASDPE